VAGRAPVGVGVVGALLFAGSCCVVCCWTAGLLALWLSIFWVMAWRFIRLFYINMCIVHIYIRSRAEREVQLHIAREDEIVMLCLCVGS
jgi:hypothetical protein